MINEIAGEIHKNNKAKGFYDGEKNIGEMLALIHSEVSEALECDRKGRECELNRGYSINPWEVLGIDLTAPLSTIDPQLFKSTFEFNVKDTFEDELADIMIRVMDLAAFKGVDLETHIKMKMKYNSLRPHKHGKKY